MFCSKCGAQLVPGAAFCSTCGAAVVAPPPPTGQATPPPIPPPPPLIPRTHFDPPRAPATPFAVNRPAIVTVLAVLQFIGGAVWLLMGFGSMANVSGVDAGAAMAVGSVFAAIGAAQIFCGLGLLRLKPYGRTLQLIFAAIGLLALPVGTIISILILIYLNKPGIKLIFAGRPGDDFTEQEIAQIKNDTATSGAMVAVIVVVGVLLILMIAGIVAAITVPALLRAEVSGNEASAIASLRAVHSAQGAYSSNCGQGGYAVSLEDLARPGPAGRRDLGLC